MRRGIITGRFVSVGMLDHRSPTRPFPSTPRRGLLLRYAASLLVVGAMLAVSVGAAQADTTSNCSTAAGVGTTTASTSTLQACGLTRVALSDTKPLPGGGTLYEYDLPDGQVVSYPKTPPGFDPTTASDAENAAYGVPPEPATTDPGYSTWLQTYGNWTLSPGANSSIILGANTDPLAGGSSSTGVQPALAGPNYAGYDNSGSGWTRSQVNYTEPTLGRTSCPGASVSFWTGIGGINSNALGQDGTVSGAQMLPIHSTFFEVLPAGQSQFMTNGNQVLAPRGSSVKAITTYAGNNSFQFEIFINGHGYVAQEGGQYDGSTADQIVERTVEYGTATPLLNFNSITMSGYNGKGQTPIADHQFTPRNMGGFATTGPLSGATFSVQQHHCAG